MPDEADVCTWNSLQAYEAVYFPTALFCASVIVQ
jgi:hypothetical protein